MPIDEQKAKPPPPSAFRIAATIGLAMLETLLFSGVSYGVVSLVPMLTDRGVYDHLCRNSTSPSNATASCSAAREQVTLAFTITQVVTPFGNLASGFIFDRWGFRATKAVAAVLFGLGSLCFTLVQPGMDWLIFPGTMMLGISGIQVIISNLQLAPMVKFPFVVASLLSGLFDACTMVTSALVQISRSGINSFIAFGVFTGVGVLTISLTIALYPGKYSLLHVESEPAPKATSLVSMHRQKLKKQPQQQQEVEKQASVESAEGSGDGKEPEPRCHVLTFLLTTDFFLMIVWMICNNLRLNYFFGSLNAYVDVITDGDKKLVEEYATMFGYFFLTSPLISLLPGSLLDLQKRFIPTLRQNTHRAYKLNTVTTLTLTPLVGVVSCLMMLPNSTGILIPVYIVMAVQRAFLFSTLGNYCISVFKPEYFGIVYTSIICTAAPFMFLTVPLTGWMESSRNPDSINFILSGLACVSLIHPLVLLLRNLRETGRKQVQPIVNQAEWDTHL